MMQYVRMKRLPTFEQLQSYGRKGAKVRWEQWRPVRDRAMKLAQEGSFANRNEAARSIAKSVIAYAASLDLRMCEYYAPVTIAGWLKNAGVTFPTR
jgi:hypothetical protein